MHAARGCGHCGTASLSKLSTCHVLPRLSGRVPTVGCAGGPSTQAGRLCSGYPSCSRLKVKCSLKMGTRSETSSLIVLYTILGSSPLQGKYPPPLPFPPRVSNRCRLGLGAAVGVRLKYAAAWPRRKTVVNSSKVHSPTKS